MPVRQRGNSWQADFSFKSLRFREDFKTENEAKLWEADTKACLLRGENPKASQEVVSSTRTMQQVLDHVQTLHWKGTKGEVTAVRNGQDCVDKIGADKPINRVTTADVDDMILALAKEGLSDSTINRKLAALSFMLRKAARRGWLNRVPEICRRKEGQHRIRWLSDDEEKNVLAYLKTTGRESMYDLVELLIDSGLRLGEAIRLEFADAKDLTIRLWGDETKSGKSRIVPMTDRVAAIVKRRQEEAGDERRVFHDLDVNTAQYAWSKVRQHMKMTDDPHFVLHALRHTFATRALKRGVSLPVLQKLLGHADIKQTMRYAHVADEDLVAAIRGRPMRMAM
jgi:integrase